jgi:hypothetical protein
MSTGDETPAWGVYPGEDRETIAPAEAGLDEQKWAGFLKLDALEPSAWEGESHGDDEWVCALACGGYLLRTWGNPGCKRQTASPGKALTWVVPGLSGQVGDRGTMLARAGAADVHWAVQAVRSPSGHEVISWKGQRQ